MNEHTVREIARVCHEINRAYCQAIGDNSQPEWDEAPDIIQDSVVAGVRLHIESLAETGAILPPGTSHQKWLEYKLAEGWKWGPVKNIDNKEHPNLVVFGQLPEPEKAKDYIFGGVIKALASSQNLV